MSLSIVQITDTHIMADPAAHFDGVDSAATLQAVLASIQVTDPQPDRILLTGDLVHDPDVAAYQRLAQLLQVAPAPIHCLPGNHDDPALMQSVLQQPSFCHDKRIVSGAWQILLLNSWLAHEHAGQLAASELEWLQRTLAAEPDLHALIALHHPPVAIGSPWMDAMGLRNAVEFFSIIDQHAQVRGVIWGHIHQEFISTRNGVQLLATPSTCNQFRPRTLRHENDELAPGYRRLKLQDDGQLETEVVRV